MNNQQEPTNTWNSAQCSKAAWMGEESGENGYIYMYG